MKTIVRNTFENHNLKISKMEHNWFGGIILSTIFLFNSLSAFGQDKFNTCSAIFIDDLMLVDEYSLHSRCIIDYNAIGTITVQPINATTIQCRPIGEIGFKLAIRDGLTNTLVSYSDETFLEEPIEKVLHTCKKTDSIVIMTQDSQYALPHNEVMIRYAL